MKADINLSIYLVMFQIVFIVCLSLKCVIHIHIQKSSLLHHLLEAFTVKIIIYSNTKLRKNWYLNSFTWTGNMFIMIYSLSLPRKSVQANFWAFHFFVKQNRQYSFSMESMKGIIYRQTPEVSRLLAKWTVVWMCFGKNEKFLPLCNLDWKVGNMWGKYITYQYVFHWVSMTWQWVSLGHDDSNCWSFFIQIK